MQLAVRASQLRQKRHWCRAWDPSLVTLMAVKKHFLGIESELQVPSALWRTTAYPTMFKEAGSLSHFA